MQVMSGILLCQVLLVLGACLWLGTALPRNSISKTLAPLKDPCFDGQECESRDCSCGQCMGCVNDVCFMELCPFQPSRPYFPKECESPLDCQIDGLPV